MESLIVSDWIQGIQPDDAFNILKKIIILNYYSSIKCRLISKMCQPKVKK
jgi:hypothetical protein